jgi:hypothetical protein
VGASPGTLVFPPGTTRLKVIRYDREQLIERADVTVDELPALLAAGQASTRSRSPTS